MRLVTAHVGEATRNFTGRQPYALIFGMIGAWVLTAVFNDCSKPGTKVPPHSVVITPESPAWQGSGFTSGKIAFSVRDAGTYSFDAMCVKKKRSGGHAVLQSRQEAQQETGALA